MLLQHRNCGREDKHHLVQLRARRLEASRGRRVVQTGSRIHPHLTHAIDSHLTSSICLVLCALSTTVICAHCYKEDRLSAVGRRCGSRSYSTAIIYWNILLQHLEAAWACNRIFRQSTVYTSPICKDVDHTNRALLPQHHPRSPRSFLMRAVRRAQSQVLSQTTFDTTKKMLKTGYMLNNRFVKRPSSTHVMPPWNEQSSTDSSRTLVHSTHHMLISHRSLKNSGNTRAGARSRGTKNHRNLSDKANARSTLSNPSSVSTSTMSNDFRTQAKDFAPMKNLLRKWWRSYGPCQSFLARARVAAAVVFFP